MRPRRRAAADAPAATPAQTREPPKTGRLLDRVAAIVNDGVVTQSDLDEQTDHDHAPPAEQKTQLPRADRAAQQVLDRLVVQEIQFQRAERTGLNVNDEQVNAALADIAQRNNIPLAQLPEALAQQGIDYAAFRDNIRKEITLPMLRQRDVLSKINVTPRELEQFLDRQKKLPVRDERIQPLAHPARHAAGGHHAQVDEIAKRAQTSSNARRREDFSRLAVAYSNSQTALEGGALGWRKGPELPTVLAELVVGLKPGEVSKPLRTPTGYHLVKLMEVRGADGRRSRSRSTRATS